jgi:hypothetical protein
MGVACEYPKFHIQTRISQIKKVLLNIQDNITQKNTRFYEGPLLA